MFFSFGCGSSSITNLKVSSELGEEPFYEISKPADAQLNKGHALYPYFQAAQARKLPLNYFRDLISSNSRITIKKGNWPSYLPGTFGSGGTISHPSVGLPFSEWRNPQWSEFYNELFHAWWGNVFTKSANYQSIRSQVLTAERKAHYKPANPKDPLLAQEEAYSETVGALMVYFYPNYSTTLPNNIGYRVLDYYKYNTGSTVSPVSHSDRPGYTPAAETTYPNPFEYSLMFKILTDHEPPS